MELPAPLAALVRARPGAPGIPVAAGLAAGVVGGVVGEDVRQPALAVVAASGCFAPTSYARARLLRQLHASGLLDDRQATGADDVLGVAR